MITIIFFVFILTRVEDRPYLRPGAYPGSIPKLVLKTIIIITFIFVSTQVNDHPTMAEAMPLVNPRTGF
jgi:hypothetical protein